MEKKELKMQIDEVVKKIKANSKDAHFAQELTDELLSLKGQYDVEPTRVCVEDKDVIKEYDFDSLRFLRCKNCIVFQDKGGFTSVISPRMVALYTHLNVFLDMKDRYETLSEGEKPVYERLYTATVWVLNTPVFATCSDKMFFGIAADVINHFQEYVDEAKNAPLKDEEAEEDAKFENTNEALKIAGGKDA